MNEKQARRKAKALGGVAVLTQESRVVPDPWVEDRQWVVVDEALTTVLAQ